MLNFNPALKECNPVLRESSFHYAFQKNFLSIELVLRSNKDLKTSEGTTFFKALEYTLYSYLDDAQGNIIPFLMQRHGIHQVSEAIVLCLIDTESNISQLIKSKIEAYFDKQKI